MTSRDTLERLAHENPVSEADLPGADTVEARKLKERILLVEPVSARSPVVERRAASLRRRPVAVAAVAVAALAVVLTLPRTLPEEHVGASPAAAAVLERAAEAATAYAGAEGRYAYTKAETLYAAIAAGPAPFAVLLPSVRETWVAADGSGRIGEVEGQPAFLGPRDRERWRASGSPRFSERPRRVDRRVRAHYRSVPQHLVESDVDTLTLEQLDRLLNAVPQLPPDPDRLERIIRAYSQHKDPPVEAQMFNQVSGLVHSPYASPELRAAAYRVLARIDGVELGGRRRDSIGRRATVVSAPAGYGGPNEATADPEDSTLNASERRHLLIDPSTGDVLAEETVLVKRVDWIDGKPGDVIGSITILEQGWVDSIDQRP